MIRDLSQSLRNLLDDPGLAPDFPELEAADVVFDRPTQTFVPAQTAVDLFLYDIHENVELRSNQPELIRSGPLATEHKPPVRLECRYLVTAWPVGGAEIPLQEHRLLSQALQVLLRSPTLPAHFLAGQLAGQVPPLPMIAPDPDGLKSPAEFWSSMGSQLRAAFTVAVTISVPALPPRIGTIVTTKRARFGPGGGPSDETLIAIGGQVVDGAGNGVGGAIVDVLETGVRVSTDADGRYLLSRVPAGNVTLRVVATGFQVAIRGVPVPGSPADYEIQLTPI